MRHLRALLVLCALLVAGVGADQDARVLRITITLTDGAQPAVPVPRHLLLVSDNPATHEPRRIETANDGTATVSLAPGSYIVESDHPVAMGGRAFQWTQVVEIVPGRDAKLDLTAANAEVVPLTAAPSAAAPAKEDDSSLLLGKWRDSVVAIWSPTARVSGFLVDRRGLIVTDQRAIGSATLVEVQVSPTLKVPARVLPSERPREAAVLLIDPGVVSASQPLGLPCPPAAAPPLDEGQAVEAIEAPYDADKDLEQGEVTALQGRRVETDLRLAFGGTGGPVFNEAGAVVGLSSAPPEDDARGALSIVRTSFICDAVTASLPSLSGAAAPEPTHLPVDSTRPFPAAALEDVSKSNTSGTPPVISSSDFDVALLTPPMVYRAKQRSDRTGGTPDRSEEVQARLGRLTDFGSWSEYFDGSPPVLIVRVAPKLVEGFWKRVGREAARTQGAVLPAFKDFSQSFGRLRATCGGVEIAPLHPFVLEHRLSDKKVVREGLYVFAADAIGPQCPTVTLSIYSEAQPENADTLNLTRTTIDRIWQDFAPYRASAPK